MSSSSSSSAAPADPTAPNLCPSSPADPEPIDCTICLDTVKVAGGLDSCIHIFCFDCIVKWSSVTNKCPVCAQKFRQIVQKDLVPQEEELDAKGKKKRKRKPKTVKVANKEQRVEYEHTGIFDDYDSEFDSEYDPEDYEIGGEFAPNYYDHMVGFMMENIFHAMNQLGNGRRPHHHPALGLTMPHMRLGMPPRGMPRPLHVVSSSVLMSGPGEVVDLTADSDDSAPYNALDTMVELFDDQDEGPAMDSRREHRGHSLFAQMAVDRPGSRRPDPAVAGAAGGSSRGRRAAAIAATAPPPPPHRPRRQPLRQRPHVIQGDVRVEATAPARPVETQRRASNRRRRSSELIELSDSESSSGPVESPARAVAARRPSSSRPGPLVRAAAVAADMAPMPAPTRRMATRRNGRH